MVEKEKIKLILTRIPGIENSRYALNAGNGSQNDDDGRDDQDV